MRDSNCAPEDVKKSRLHHHLEELGVRADELEEAYIKSITTSEGYSNHFGKPAIKAYKSFFKQKAGEDIDVAANRFARQIDCESDQGLFRFLAVASCQHQISPC